jgi:ATP-dependent RNA helicase DDX10/DBP4
VKFVKGEDAKARKNAPRQLLAALSGSGDDDEEEESDREARKKKKTDGVRTKYDRMFERQNQDVLSGHYSKLIDDEDEDDAATGKRKAHLHNEDDDNDADFLSVKRRFEAGDAGLDQEDSASDNETDKLPSKKIKTLQLSTRPDAEPLVIDSHRREKLLTSRKKLLKYKGAPTHMTFDSDSDTPKNRKAYKDESTFTAAEKERADFLAKEREKTTVADAADKEVAKAKKREKRQKRKERERLEESGGGGVDAEVDGDGEDVGVQLVPYDEDEEQDHRPRSEAEVDEQPKPKRAKKWFEDPDSDDDDGQNARVGKKTKRSRGGRNAPEEEPRTLEDLEALASGLLAGK